MGKVYPYLVFKFSLYLDILVSLCERKTGPILRPYDYQPVLESHARNVILNKSTFKNFKMTNPLAWNLRQHYLTLKFFLHGRIEKH